MSKYNFTKIIDKFRLTLYQFLTLFSITFIFFLILQFSNLNHARKQADIKFMEDTNLLITRVNSTFDNDLDIIRNMLYVVSARKDILNPENQNLAIEFLRNFCAQNANIIRTIYLVRNDGEVLSSNNALYGIYGNGNLETVISNSLKSEGNLNWSEPYYSRLSGETVAFSFTLKENNGSYQGMIIIEINLDSLKNSITPLLAGRDQTFVILSADRNKVFFDDTNSMLPLEKSSYPYEIEAGVMKRLTNCVRGKNIVEIGGETYIAVKANSSRIGWEPVILKKQKNIDESLSAIYTNFYINTLLCFIILVFACFMLSYYFTIPIRKLARKMDKIKEIDSLKPLKVKREDEIGRLTESYNRMIKRIHDLLIQIKDIESKKKDYELKMLQSQIGPHFLYNTLACIGSLARQNRNEEVNKAVQSLVKLLSFGFNRGSELVTVREELEGIKAYIEIQKIRYGNMFDLSIVTDESIVNQKILKLTLQPLVENAIFHGIVPKNGMGYIRIKIYEHSGAIIVIVRDNGVGIDPEVCRNILNIQSGIKLHDRFSSIGIANVHDRILINYGEGYGLKIRSRQNLGTIVRVRLPVIKQ